jgi:hypothetical protein
MRDEIDCNSRKPLKNSKKPRLAPRRRRAVSIYCMAPSEPAS